jgi:hypothetical protein
VLHCSSWLHEEGSEQAHEGFAVGEDADDALAAAHLLVEPFHPLRCSQPATVRLGQSEDGGGIVEAGFQDGQYLLCANQAINTAWPCNKLRVHDVTIKKRQLCLVWSLEPWQAFLQELFRDRYRAICSKSVASFKPPP